MDGTTDLPRLLPGERSLVAWAWGRRAAHDDTDIVRWQDAMYGDRGVACYLAALMWQLVAGLLGLVGVVLLVATRGAAEALLPLGGCAFALLVMWLRVAQMVRSGRVHRGGARFVKRPAWLAAQGDGSPRSRS